MSKNTQFEFGLKDHEIPTSMKKEIPADFVYVNHIDQNITLTGVVNELQ